MLCCMQELLTKKSMIPSLSGLFRKDSSVLGIDVGTSSLKILQIKKENERAVLETYGELSTGAYTGIEAGRAVMLMDEKVSQMIIDLKQEAGATAHRAFISMPLRYSFITVIEMPDLPDHELQDAIQFEARRYIPIPLSDVTLEWWRIALDTDLEQGAQRKKTVSILLAAVQREVIEKYKRMLKDAQIEFLGFEIEVFAASRALAARSRSATMLIDIGALSTKLSIVEHGMIRAVHNIERASQAFTLAISQSLGIDFKRAELMKHDIGMTERPEASGIRHTITPLADSLFDEADRLRSSYRRKSGSTVDKVILLGGGSLMPGFLEYAIERMGLEVLASNPFGTLEYPAIMQPVIKKIAPSFSISTGLALRALWSE